jgi:hypothetical protein
MASPDGLVYTSCIFCQNLLGSNDHIAHFPVGRRLAFDSAKGRLWAVCQRCAQWNLAPLEERWEAVEDCERAYRVVRTRVSTAEIGLARLPDGMDLIRIGAPLRPEFAAWRFGDQLGARLRKSVLRAAAGGALLTAGGLAVTAVGSGLAFPVVVPALVVVGAIAAIAGTDGKTAFSNSRALRFTTATGEYLDLGNRETLAIEMRSNGKDGFHLAIDITTEEDIDGRSQPSTQRVTIVDGEAVRAARLLLPRVNSGGAARRSVQHAVRAIEDAGSAERFIPSALERMRKSGFAYSPIWEYPSAIRLGIEMALHEDAERRAMDGELTELEAAWREAERVAGIADNLLLPPHVNVFMDRHRKRR